MLRRARHDGPAPAKADKTYAAVRITRADTWRRVAGAYFPILLFAALALSTGCGGLWYAAPAAFVLVIVPILDKIAGDDRGEFSAEDFSVAQAMLMRAAPAIFVLLYAGALIAISRIFGSLSVVEQTIAVFSFGIIGSIEITAAHELVHKHNKTEKLLGRFGLLLVGYMHFEINHIEGHHINACTDKDESTGWRGESVFSYVIRTVPACYKLSWEIEARRCRRKGQSALNAHNRMLYFVPLPLGLLALLWLLGGPAAAVFYVVQSAIAIVMLEAVAFIEHYGLLRAVGDVGKSGRMTLAHSWNTYHRFSNYLTFGLQRHADHHSLASKPYYLLDADADAPELPFGYPVMITLAFVPPLWRAVMHPRLEELDDQVAAGRPPVSASS
jgi:alkane 1-monooxygenase